MNMKPSVMLHSNRDAIRRLALEHRVTNVRVFGSVLRGEDVEGSDLDLLVDPTPDTTLFDIGAIQAGTQRLLGVPVDVLTPNSLPEKYRQRVLEEAMPL